jgi:hypothetical protein
MAKKRDLETLQRLLAKFGDIRLSEALGKVQEPRTGKPLQWNVHRLSELFLFVEDFKTQPHSSNQGLVGRACKAFAREHGRSNVRKHYYEAKARFDPIFLKAPSEILRNYRQARCTKTPRV